MFHVVYSSWRRAPPRRGLRLLVSRPCAETVTGLSPAR